MKKATRNRLLELVEDSPISAVDLFCGAGGLGLGFKRTGEFTFLEAFDHLQAAVDTYRQNVGDHIRCASIDEQMELPEASVVIGGPPCQGFSSAGMRRSGDQRNTLVSVFAGLIVRLKPIAFVFENVEGFLTAEGGARVFDLLDPVIEAGYRVHLRKVNVANYGIPQHRKRVIGIGGLGWDPSFPGPTHSAFGAPGATLAATELPACPTVQDALAGLPEPGTEPPGHPPGHFCSPPSAEELERLRVLKPGQTMRNLPPELWHDSYKRRAFRRVMDGTPTERRGGAPAGKRRLRGDEPSKAITGGARGEFVHPYVDRYLTLRECARIQTFEDEFEFIGSLSDQALLIGNAVPPSFGEVIARSLAMDLRAAVPGSSPGGSLLSFVPTLSTGMSPALTHVTDRVSRRFGTTDALDPEPLQMSFQWD